MIFVFSNVLLGKAAGNDKKLLQQILKKYPEGIAEEFNIEMSSASASNLMLASSPTKINSMDSAISEINAAMPIKLFYFLISTMNLMFPDYDFW